jgi:probable rRNA maturation factor
VPSIYLAPWRIDVTIRDSVIDAHGGRRPVSIAPLARAIAAALDAAGAPSPASIGLILSDDEELATLNETHLGHEGPTDVLSFPLLAPASYPPHDRGPGAGDLGQGERPPVGPDRQGAPDSLTREAAAAPVPFATPPGQRVHLGDLVLSVERARQQAEQGRGGQTGDVRWSTADELRLLVTHGTLHICGWDHAERAEEAAMRALEQRLLASR